MIDNYIYININFWRGGGGHHHIKIHIYNMSYRELLMRIVNCFTMKRPFTNNIDVDVVYKAFGNNIPKYCIYDGCITGCVYLCCVDKQIDVKKICKSYGYELNTLYEMEIQDDMYNNNFTIYPTYKANKPHYKLEKH